jgi:hypothetical protein
MEMETSMKEMREKAHLLARPHAPTAEKAAYYKRSVWEEQTS